MESKARVNYGNGLYGENNTIDFDKYLSDEMLPYTSALLKSDFEFYIQFFYRAIYKDYFRTCWFHKEIIKSLEEFVYGNPERKNLAISIPPRWGKLIADETPVLTKRGWITHAEIVVGDYVLSPSGKFVKVLAVSEKAPANCKVRFSDGDEIYCHENHEWVVYDRHLRKERTIETKEMLEKGFYRDRYLLPEISNDVARQRRDLKAHKKEIFFESVERGDFGKIGNCIQVEGGVYCVGNRLKPTHNSILMIMWISWCFGIDSTCNFIYTCYEERITNKMSDDILNIIRHPFYQKLFGVQMNSNTEAKALWETKEKGTYRASPMGGAMTGFGCFDKDTPVWTENGVEKIGDIVEGKKKVKIMTFDGEKISFEEIERYVKNDISQYKRIIFEDGEVLDATNDHIFHTTEGEKRADELSVNSVLLSDARNNGFAYAKPFYYIFSRIIFVADKLSILRRKLRFVPRDTTASLKSETLSNTTPINSSLNVGYISKIKTIILSNLFIGASVLRNFFGLFWRNFVVSGVVSIMSYAILLIIGLCSIGKIGYRIVECISVKMSNYHSSRLRSKKCPSNQLVDTSFNSFPTNAKVNAFVAFTRKIRAKLFSCFRRINASVSGNEISFKLRNRNIFAIYDIHNKPSYCLTLRTVNNLFVGMSRVFVHNCGKIGDRFGGAFIIDDPLNAKFFNSEAEKKKVEDNYQAVIKKRLNNPSKTPIVLIMQRLAVDDLVGYIEANEADDWKIIRVPALNEDVNPPKSNWEWKSPTEVLLKEKKQSPYIFAAQMQQSPVVLGGELVKEEWFKFYNPLDTVRYKKVFFTADTAFKTNEWNDYTAVGLWAITEKNDLRLIDLLHKKIEAVDLLKEFFAFKNRWSGGVRGLPANVFYIEDKASGMELIQRMRREGGVSVIPVKDKGFDKMTKWNNSLFPYLEAGNVLLPNDKNDPRSKEIIAEMVLLCGDGSHKHDDICDMMTQAGEIAFGKKGMF
jgi:predicted phage terminase large subunit-like protein